MPSDQIFTPDQEKVLSLLAAGYPATVAAAKAGIHRNTVGNWLRIPAFRQTLSHIQYQKALLWREKAEELVPAAFDIIHRLMVDPGTPAGFRLKAAQSLIAAATAPLPVHPDDAPLSVSVHKGAQPVYLPELPPPAEPAPEPHNPAQLPAAPPRPAQRAEALRAMHNPAQAAAINPSQPFDYDLLGKMARDTGAQRRAALLAQAKKIAAAAAAGDSPSPGQK